MMQSRQRVYEREGEADVNLRESMTLHLLHAAIKRERLLGPFMLSWDDVQCQDCIEVSENA